MWKIAKHISTKFREPQATIIFKSRTIKSPRHIIFNTKKQQQNNKTRLKLPLKAARGKNITYSGTQIRFMGVFLLKTT